MKVELDIAKPEERVANTRRRGVEERGSGGDNMWLCFNDGFVSAVQHNDDRDLLVVRARKRDHLLSLIGASASISESSNTDYRYRVIVSKSEFERIVGERIMEIDYGNFKDSVEDDDLHDLYADFWVMHRRYQEELVERLGEQQ